MTAPGSGGPAGRPVEVRADLRTVAPYRAPQASAPVRLNTNESPWPPPEGLVAEIADRLRGLELNRYPDREARALRAALGARARWPTEGIWVANGSNEIIQTLLLAFGGPGRRALLFEPTYAMHAHIARLAGAEVVRRRIPEPWVLDPAAVRAAVEETDPAVTFICSPNNPTGTRQPDEAVAAALGAGRGLVVVDEAYGEFAEASAAPLLGRAERLAVVRTFSKAWRLAGARLGYLLAAPWLVEAIQVARLPYHLSAIAQICGEAALRHEATLRAGIAELIGERDRLATELARVPGVETFPSAANFILFRTPLQGPAMWQALADGGVLVRDVSEAIPRALRVTVGTGEQNAAFVEALRGVLAHARA